MAESDNLRKLTAAEATLQIDTTEFEFEITDELEPLGEIVGQPRAMKALDLGLGVRHRNYHIYVAGLVGTGRLDLVREAIEARLGDSPVPPDWMFVNNFDEPDCPISLCLTAGRGSRLKRDLEELIEYLREALPKAFREEDFGQEKEKLRKHYREKGDELLSELEKLAEGHGMTVQQMPNGQILFIPLKDGRPMTPEEVEQLSAEELEGLERHQDELVHMAAKVVQQQQQMQKRLSTDVHEVARQFAARIVEPLIDNIKQQYGSEPCTEAGTSKLHDWLDGLGRHIVQHVDRFRDLSDVPPPVAAMLLGEQGADPAQRFLDYEVNLVVDNGGLERAPIIIEPAPNYRNLFGTIERIVDRSGKVITNFTRIKSGSLLQANGGYLLVNLMDALTEPYVWKQLKRTLKSGLLEIEVYDPFSLFTVSGLKPQPIPLNVRLVAVGEPLIYHLLYLYDEDFREIFRVKADFDDELDRDEHAGRLYGGLVRKLSKTEGLQPFDQSAVAELIRVGARLTSNRRKLSTLFSHVADVVREADYWARRDAATYVSERHVTEAIRERVHRSDLIAEKIRELIEDGRLLVDVEGEVVGQINGLSVADLGDHAFGRPSRLTASVGVGTGGLVNIERESRLSGRTFDKGLLILEGYLRNQYAHNQPLALSASLAMEQSYGGVDGDSASAAELLCLLSAISDLPLRQDIAITGSINQLGQVQAIGGANEKIEGFFDVCAQRGLTGTQGVCIPTSNVQDLVLRPDVVHAIDEDRFHVWPVATIDEALQLLTGTSAGAVDKSDTVHGKVAARLAEMVDVLRNRQVSSERPLWTPGMPAELPPDPRPPFPGRGERNSPARSQDSDS